jgi:hypothetical protein
MQTNFEKKKEAHEKYKKADLETLIPTKIILSDGSTKPVMIPKKELWYERNAFSGHKSSGFRLDYLLTALANRGIRDFKGAYYDFI